VSPPDLVVHCVAVAYEIIIIKVFKLRQLNATTAPGVERCMKTGLEKT